MIDYFIPLSYMINMSSADFAGVAIVTGSAGGIGRGIALKLAEDGYDVALFDLPSAGEKLQQVADEIKRAGKRSLAITGDVSLEEDVKGLVERVADQLGSVDAVSPGVLSSDNLPQTMLQRVNSPKAGARHGSFSSTVRWRQLWTA